MELWSAEGVGNNLEYWCWKFTTVNSHSIETITPARLLRLSEGDGGQALQSG